MNRRVLGYRETQILAIIRSDLEQRGRVRSYAAIARHLGMKHRSHVCDVIGRLERRGLIERDCEASRFNLKLLAGTPRTPCWEVNSARA